MAIGSARIVFEVIANQGSDPTTQVDTDDLDPPVYTDLVQRSDGELQVATDDVDVSWPIPADACALLLVADEPVLVRFEADGKQLRVRNLFIGAEDKSGAAFPSGELLISGNTTNIATVRVITLGKV